MEREWLTNVLAVCKVLLVSRELRKRVQYSGELRRVRLEYSGPSIEAVLDRLPTVEVLAEKDGCYTVSAEVYGNGIDMWLSWQGEKVEVL